MEPIKIAQAINSRIIELENLKKELPLLAENKSTSEADYERELATVMWGLKCGKEYELNGETVKEPPVSIIEKLAKGIIWQVKLAMDLKESRYKNALKIIDITEAQLNGYQSINRYFSET